VRYKIFSWRGIQKYVHLSLENFVVNTQILMELAIAHTWFFSSNQEDGLIFLSVNAQDDFLNMYANI
jgi:hypothetical protein